MFAHPATLFIVSGVDEDAADVADGHGALRLREAGVQLLPLRLEAVSRVGKQDAAVHITLLRQHLTPVQRLLLLRLPPTAQLNTFLTTSQRNGAKIDNNEGTVGPAEAQQTACPSRTTSIDD